MIQNKKGFSMGETILAIFVLSIGITAMIGFISKSILDSMDNRDAIIGAGLAQEGVELMRNLKDSNLLQDQVYDNGMIAGGACVSATTATYADPDLSCADRKLYYDPVARLYVHDSSKGATRFSRNILFVSETPARVTSVVWWGSAEPDVPVSELTCNLGKKCAFATVEFNDLVLGL